MNSDATVLIVEDDAALSMALEDGFRSESYDVISAGDGEAGLAAAQTEDPDLIVLDLMLPKLPGLDVCQRLRQEGSETPIVMLSARGDEVDRILGLKLGADDYVTKPFSLAELLARAEAVLRRCGASDEQPEPDELTLGDVTVDFVRHEASLQPGAQPLSPREFEMLRYLAGRRGQVVTRDDLLRDVWGYAYVPATRTVDTHIAKLRKKIEADPAQPKHLITVHRLGYKLV